MNFSTKKILLAVLFGLCVLLFGAVSIALYAYFECFYHPKRKRKSKEKCYQNHKKRGEDFVCSLMDSFMERKCERVEITSHDGLKLYGYYYHVKEGAPVEIGFHGYRSNAVRDFCGGGAICLDNGINLLLVDQRAHGDSTGESISFGINERLDCKCWVDYVKQRFGNDVKIILAGVSMGAGTVLMASDMDFGGNVRCIVADCPYSDQSQIIKLVCSKRKLDPKLFYPFIKLSAKTIGGFDLEEYTPLKAVAHTKIPILLIHGEADNFVPCSMSKDLYDACTSEKQLVVVKGAGHAMSYVVDEKLYKKTVLDFFSKHLN